MKRGMTLIALGALLIALALPLTFASAQGTLNGTADPNYGTYPLEAGFLPDPYIITMLSGGEVDAATAISGGQCLGNVTSNPDIKIEWSGSTANLRLFYASEGDTTLIVQLPNGQFLCNDDGQDSLLPFQPILDIANPVSGTYSVWVGTYAPTQENPFIPGYLVITELPFVPGGIDSPLLGTGSLTQGSQPPAPPTTPNQQTGAGLNFNAQPNYGTANLSAGFQPDPHTANVVSGGPVDTLTQNLGNPACRGFVANAPDYAVNWSGASQLLRIFFVSQGDTTLVIRTPSGQFVCNDDAATGGLNPMADITNPAAGQYLIWVGSFNPNETIQGTLVVTEIGSLNPSTIGSN